MVSSVLKSLDFSRKDEFSALANHITQSWEWGEFRSQTPTIKKVLRLGSFDGDKLVRVFQIIFSKIPYLPYTVAYLPRSPMPTPQELEEIKKFCRTEKAMFLKIEPGGVYSVSSIKYQVSGNSSPVLPQHTIYIDLTLPEEKLLSRMHEKTRYNLRLAQKKGVIVKEENTQGGLEKFIRLLEKTEKRQGFYSHKPDYYRLLWKSLSPKGIVHILSASLPPISNPLSHSSLPLSRPISSIMLFHYKNFLYYPYGGSDPDFREYMAPTLLHWEAIKLGKKLGCKTYDLWGSYKNTKSESDLWWGIYRFKSGFGGTELSFPDSLDIPLSPWYSIFTAADSLRWTLLRTKRELLASG